MTTGFAQLRRLLGVAVCTLAAAPGHSSPRNSLSAPNCTRVVLSPAPSWTFYAEWNRDGDELIVPDTMASRLLRINPRKGTTTLLPATGDLHRPVEVRRSEERFVVRDGGDRLIAFGFDWTRHWNLRLPDLAVSGEKIGHLGSFLVHEKTLFAFVVLVDDANKETWSGFARVSLDPPRVGRQRRVASVRTPAGDVYYSHAGPFLARVGGAVYLMVLGADPHIERIYPTPHTLRAFPRGLHAPEQRLMTGPSSMAAWFGAWETSSAPEALFGRGASLFLLARRYTEGRVHWMLHEIDPAQDVIVRTMELPSRAPHIVVAPGPIHWALLEKGTVTGSSDPTQTVGPVVFIPTSRIENREAKTDLADCLNPR